MSYEEVEKLKLSGVKPQDIIERQMSQHAGFSLKTEYSKDKYKKRKEAKFSRVFTVIDPTIHNVCEYWFKKDQGRIRDLRVDSLSQVLTLGDVRPGGRYLVVDEASGILISSILDRLDGCGRVLAICAVESQPVYHFMQFLNFPSYITEGVYDTISWGFADPDYTPVSAAPSELSAESQKAERQKARKNKREAAAEDLDRIRKDFFSGSFDGLLVSSEYDSYSIIQRLIPYLAGSSSIVVHSPFLPPLCETQSLLRNDNRILSPSVSESWLRKYQVLPGRTHPLMTSSGSGGYILHAIRVYGDLEEYEETTRNQQATAPESDVLAT